MATATTAGNGRARVWPHCGAATWLALAASPSLALMAAITASHPPALCTAGGGALPVDGMAAMYLLMSLFHLSPWLKLVVGR